MRLNREQRLADKAQHPERYCAGRRKDGSECVGDRVKGRDTCRMHGGTNPGRPPIHGRRSKYAPQRLGAQYQAALGDQELTSLREDIAFSEALVSELVTLADAAKGCPLCAEACNLYEEARALMGSTAKAEKCNELLARMHAFLRAGRDGEGVTAKLAREREAKRRMTATENRREKDLADFTQSEQANVLILAIVNLANECIRDQAERTRFAAALMAFGNAGASRREDRGG